MPDYSLCVDHNCPSKYKCYRYMAEPNEFRQAYSDFSREGQKCDYYFPIENSPTALRGSNEIKKDTSAGLGNNSRVSGRRNQG